MQHLLETDKHHLVRGYALMSFGDICIAMNQLSYGKEVLLSNLKNERSNFVRINYYAYLYRMGEKAYLNNLIKQLDSKRINIRISVVVSFEEILNDENRDRLIKALLSRKKIESEYAVICSIDEALQNMQ